jgi:hypothetical protein
MKHPSDEALLALALGTEDGSRGEATRRHMDGGCAVCARKVREYGRVMEAIRAPTGEDPPPAWQEEAIAWIHEAVATERRPADEVPSPFGRAARTAKDAVREFLAVLTLDTGMAPVPAGIRGSAASKPRQLMYRSPAGNVHVQITWSGARPTIVGQFVHAPEAPSGPGRAVIEAGGRRMTQPLSADGGFAFRPLPKSARPIRLTVESAAGAVVVEALPI